MEAKQKEERTIPTDPVEQAKFLRELAEEIGDRDLFPEKTASAKRFLDRLEKSQQRITPKVSAS
ncbi:hypothetical protein [Dyadobacter sandarakinus]|uniref:Uncharacterized protein n=1 Tax=Dyadobacter sandarakinus TaxID=2747268 RepID=A0ABX7IF98_9BACT|nr:hypothetical protein [Dyadobacter sandarakinus]QRR03546.1 hypothetical protein HWI92_22840 [Dyadobacter sandarakinus]